MCSKILAIVFLVLALIMGIAVTVIPQERLMDLVYISRFIEVMIPVLAVGALIKFLFTCRPKQ
jgi:hypothetical protein